MKKRAKPVGKKAAKKSATKKPAAKSLPASSKRAQAAKAPPPRPATVARGPATPDRVTVEAARYTPRPVQSTGWPPFRYPPQ
jgi:hypothetical protein